MGSIFFLHFLIFTAIFIIRIAQKVSFFFITFVLFHKRANGLLVNILKKQSFSYTTQKAVGGC